MTKKNNRQWREDMKDNLEEISNIWVDSDLKEQAENAAWFLGDYVSGACVNCGRHRVCQCPNGKTRCEKCNWVEQDNSYCPKSL